MRLSICYQPLLISAQVFLLVAVLSTGPARALDQASDNGEPPRHYTIDITSATGAVVGHDWIASNHANKTTATEPTPPSAAHGQITTTTTTTTLLRGAETAVGETGSSEPALKPLQQHGDGDSRQTGNQPRPKMAAAGGSSPPATRSLAGVDDRPTDEPPEAATAPQPTTATDTSTDDSLSNTTLLIDYDRQGYNNPAATTAPSGGGPAGATSSSYVESGVPQSAASALTPPTQPPLTLAASTGADGVLDNVQSSQPPQLKLEPKPEQQQSAARLILPDSSTAAESVIQHSHATPQINNEHVATPSAPDGIGAEPYVSRSAHSASLLHERATSEPSYFEDISEKQLNAASGSRQPPQGLRSLDLNSLTQNASTNQDIYSILFKRKPFSKLWSAEQKWDDLFKRLLAIQDTIKDNLLKHMMRDVEYYADISISRQCANDIKFMQTYSKSSTNFRWLMHMLDALGKSEPGMLSGNMAHLGHVIQCIKVRAPSKPTNLTFDERYFEQQTRTLGERFRGKYCLASIRPVMPSRPPIVTRFEENELFNISLLSNISYAGLSGELIRRRLRQDTVDPEVHDFIDRAHLRLDQIPFESELYQYVIDQRNFMFSLPHFLGVCYPSSCTTDDIRYSLQKTIDQQHQVVDIEFECEVEEYSVWDWFNTPRLVAYVMLLLVIGLSLSASLVRYILVDKLGIKRNQEARKRHEGLLDALDLLSMDKCAGILFVKTKTASPIVDATKVENFRSTTIDALKGVLILALLYNQLVYLGCLPLPFMWSRWSDAMFPFYRSLRTQPLLNTQVWTQAFYLISGYLIAAKILANDQPAASDKQPPSTQDMKKQRSRPLPDFMSYILNRYIRLVLPVVAFVLLNYVWPRLSNGFVMQDQASKLLVPCDQHGWTNFLLFHNWNSLNETCLWPTHVSAGFFQLHIVSYPILVVMLLSLRTMRDSVGTRKLLHLLLTCLGCGLAAMVAVIGLLWPAMQASNQKLIVPFLIDYIDYDNYARVIEWTVMPTHNYATSYMFGIAIAYLMVRARVSREIEVQNLSRVRMSQPQQSTFTHRYASFDSGLSDNQLASTTQPSIIINSSNNSIKSTAFEHCINVSPPAANLGHYDVSLSSSSSDCIDSVASIDRVEDVASSDGYSTFWGQTVRYGTSCLVYMVLVGSLTASWLWNGLSQPMSSIQTFWYMVLTKLAFNVAFARLFYVHFATRRNSSNPWMITRFLVPIGRMSLTVFYVSWLVIWFDLLSSLYQWHPSHYFVMEKYNEIVFITLVLSMLVYGAFEGAHKIIGHREKRSQLLRKSKSCQHKDSDGTDGVEHEASCLAPVENFDIMFAPRDKQVSNQDSVKTTTITSVLTQPSSFVGLNTSLVGDKQSKSGSPTRIVLGKLTNNEQLAARQNQDEPPELHPTRRTLSVGDRNKLNAELRANPSFASLGLYESAGLSPGISYSSNLDHQGTNTVLDRADDARIQVDNVPSS